MPRPPKSYLTTAFSAPMRAQKARIANLFAVDRRRGRFALALLAAAVMLSGALVSCVPEAPAPTHAPSAPTLTPIPISSDAGFYDGETLHTLGEGLAPLLDEGDEYLMPPHLYGRQVNRRWKNADDGAYRANSYYTVDRSSGALRLNCFQWSSPSLSTARGAKVGDSLADVQALYPGAELQPDTLYFRDEDCQVVFEFWEDAVSQISLYTERFPVTVNNAFPYNAVPLGGPDAADVLPGWPIYLAGQPPRTFTAAELDAAPYYRFPDFTDELVRLASGPDGWALYSFGGQELLRRGDRWLWCDLPWDQTIDTLPQLWCADFDGDGGGELALSCASGGNQLRYRYLFLLDPDADDKLWALEPPMTDAISLYAACSADRGALLLQADYAALAIDSAALDPELMKHADTLSVDFGRAVEFRQNGNSISVTLPVLLHAPYAGDLQFDPEGAIFQEVAVFSADVVYLPGADCYTYTNFRLDTGLDTVPMPSDQPPELRYEVTNTVHPQTGVRRATLVSGEVPLDCWFEIPVFSEDGPGYAAINEFFSELSGAFFSPENENLTEAWVAANYSPQATETSPFYYRHNAVVRSHDDSLLSVTIDWDWWIGGVHNSGWDCYNFDPATGKQVLLSGLISEREDEALIAIHRAMSEDEELRYSVTPGDYLADDPYDLLGRSLDSFDFYVEAGKVYLAFDSYEATAGAGGSPVLEVPLHRRLPACPPSAIDSTVELP